MRSGAADPQQDEDRIALGVKSKQAWKARTIEQWTETPCGSTYVQGQTPGTEEFFRAASQYRYQIAHPWLPRIAPFRRARGKHVLEVGCGLGFDGAQFAAAGANWLGFDLTPEHLRLARAHFESEELLGQFARGDAELLPFADRSFDLVYSFGVLHHTPGTEAGIDEIHRVLKPAGRAFVMLYHRNSLAVLSMWLRFGILKGELRDGGGLAGLLSRHVEAGSEDSRPLVKVYSRAEVRRMFDRFRTCRISTYQNFHEEAMADRIATNPHPSALLRAAKRASTNLLGPWGFYLIIEAQK